MKSRFRPVVVTLQLASLVKDGVDGVALPVRAPDRFADVGEDAVTAPGGRPSGFRRGRTNDLGPEPIAVVPANFFEKV